MKTQYVLLHEERLAPLLGIIENLLIHIDGSSYYSPFYKKLRSGLNLPDLEVVDLNEYVKALKPRIDSFINDAKKREAGRPCRIIL